MLWLWHWHMCCTWVVFWDAFKWEHNLLSDCGESGSCVDIDPPMSRVVTIVPEMLERCVDVAPLKLRIVLCQCVDCPCGMWVVNLCST